jgi:hypothetical protein
LLKLEDVPSFWMGLEKGLEMAAAWFAICLIYGGVLFVVLHILNVLSDRTLGFFLSMVFLGGCIVAVLLGLSDHFRAKVANGSRPAENSRRQKAYAEARAVALKAAEPLKAAEDHRLRCQIRELEGLAKTVGEKKADVRRLLATL